MARAGRIGGMGMAREAINVISSLDAEGAEISPETIVSRLNKTPEEAEKFLDMLSGVGSSDGNYLRLYPEEKDGSGSLFSERAGQGRQLRLTWNETLAVQVALEWMDTPEDDPLAVRIGEALGARDFNSDAVRRMLAPAGSAEVEATRRACANAIACGRDLRFSYLKSGASAAESRRVHSGRLQQDDGTWYLIGLDLDRAAERNFRLDRMSEVEAVTAGAEAEAATAPEAPASQRMVTLTFDSEHWLELLPWHRLELRREANGTIVARTPWYGGEWLPRMIAACGGHVTCDDPELAASVRGLAAAELEK